MSLGLFYNNFDYKINNHAVDNFFSHKRKSLINTNKNKQIFIFSLFKIYFYNQRIWRSYYSTKKEIYKIYNYFYDNKLYVDLIHISEIIFNSYDISNKKKSKLLLDTCLIYNEIIEINEKKKYIDFG